MSAVGLGLLTLCVSVFLCVYDRCPLAFEVSDCETWLERLHKTIRRGIVLSSTHSCTHKHLLQLKKWLQKGCFITGIVTEERIN